MSSSKMKVFLEEVDKNSETAFYKWSRKALDMELLSQIVLLGPAPTIGLAVFFFDYKRGELGFAAILLLLLLTVGYVFFRAIRKHFNYRITEKGVRIIYWDDYPEIAAQSLHFLAGVYILVAIIAGLYMGPMVLVGAGGIGLAHAMGMQRITRNENVATREWKDFDRVIVCRKRNMLESDAAFRIYFNKAMTIDEFIGFANKHRDKDVEVEEGEITYLGTLR